MLLFAVFGVWFVPSSGQAHQTALSTMKVDVGPDEQRVHMRLAMSPTDLADHLDIDPDDDGVFDQDDLEAVAPRFAEYVLPRLGLTNDGQACPVAKSGLADRPRREPTIVFEKIYECDTRLGQLAISNSVLLESPNGYTHYAQIEVGGDVHTTVFDTRSSTYRLEVGGAGAGAAEGAASQSFVEVAKTYVWQGILHIVLGLDHVLFVICLLLAARELKRLIGVVTTFTLAHSVTLALSTLEVVVVPASIIEPLIALSIVWAAVEILLGREPEEYLYVLTFAFGLLHGFGFSYVLQDVGLPSDALAGALFSFNVGVEVGQVAIVVLAFPFIKWAEEQDWGAMAFRVVGGLVLAVSVYWLVERTIAAF